MKTKIVCATAVILLIIFTYTVTAVSSSYGNVVNCIKPHASKMAVDLEDGVDLCKDIVNVINGTVTTLKACISAAKVNSGSSASGGQSLSNCLMAAYAKLAPQYQQVKKQIDDVMPRLEADRNITQTCLHSSSPTTMPPAST